MSREQTNVVSVVVSARDASEVSAEAIEAKLFTYGREVHPRRIALRAGPLNLTFTIDSAEAAVEALQDALREAMEMPSEADVAATYAGEAGA